MKRFMRSSFISLCFATSLFLAAQPARPGLLSADELKKVVPAAFFFGGQSAPVQMRNSGGFRAAGGKLVLAGLVDTSGYATDMAAKYQGFLITETRLSVEGSDLGAGAYGFGFTKDGKFVVMDVGANELASVSSKLDENLKRPVPLKIVEDAGGYRLYAGKQWVNISVR